VPEGDTIYRAARTLHRALAGRTVTRFETVFPRLARLDTDAPLRGRVIEAVEARGKHLLVRFSGGLVLRTHMRMHGSWHIYRPGERWQRPRRDMRIVIETAGMHAVGFSVPVAEFIAADALDRHGPLRDLGPDPLAPDFQPEEAAARIAARAGTEIADALLDQSAIAGIGNVYKSEILFMARVSPFARVRDLDRRTIERIVALAVKYMRANVAQASGAAIVTYGGLRRTTARDDPSARLWVYRREGQACRRCGTRVSRVRQGPHARSTYWCPRCQAPDARHPDAAPPGSDEPASAT
jgi:endonuclease-8